MPACEKIRRLKKMSTVLKNTSANANTGTSAKMRLSGVREWGMSTSAKGGMSTSAGGLMSGRGMSTSAKGLVYECSKQKSRVAVKLRGLLRSSFTVRKLPLILVVNFIVEYPICQAAVGKS